MAEKIHLIDVGRMAGFKQASAWSWIKKPDFPKPAGIEIGKNHRLSNVFDKEEVMHWLIKHGKIPVPDGYVPPEETGVEIQKTFEEDSRRLDNALALDFLTGGRRETRKNDMTLIW